MDEELVIPTLSQFADILGIDYDPADPVAGLPVTLEQARRYVSKQMLLDPDDIPDDLKPLKTRVLTMPQAILVPGKIKTMMSYEYLVFSGYPLVDMQCYLDNNSRVQMKIDISSTQKNGYPSALFMAREAYLKPSFGIWAYTSNKFKAHYNKNTKDIFLPTQGLFEIDFNQNTVTINTETITFSKQTFTPTRPLIIASATRGNSYDARKVTGNVYYVKVYDNGTLIRDCVPAKNIKTNEVGLYDKINSKLYKNAGTGTFTTGPETGYI